MYELQQIVDAFSVGSPIFTTALIALIIAMSFGFIEYAIATVITRREGKTPFPAWVHCFMMAHDMTAAVIMLPLAVSLFMASGMSNGAWYFFLQGGGMLAWVFMELINLRTVVNNETEEVWGPGVSKKECAIRLAIIVVVFLALINIIRYFMNDVAMFFWPPMTNIVMAVAPVYVLYKRNSRAGSSVLLYIVILGGTIFNFMPEGIGLWATVLPSVFNQPIWFIVGAVCVAVAAYNLYTITKLPPKEQVEGQKKPVW